MFIGVRFEVFTPATMKNAVFWYVTPCGSCTNRFVRTSPYHSDVGGVRFLRIVGTNKATRRNIPEDGILKCLLIFGKENFVK
jgi:hypothetical protein